MLSKYRLPDRTVRWLVPGMAVLLLLAALLPSLVPGDAYRVNNFHSNLITLRDGWDYAVSGDSRWEGQSLPADIPPRGEVFEFSTTLPGAEANFLTAPALFLQVKYCQFEVVLNGVILKSFYPPQDGRSGSSGVATLLVQLPEDWEGGRLSIRGSSLLSDAAAYRLAPPLLGPAADIGYHTLTSEAPVLLGDSAILLLGTGLLAASFLFRRDRGISRRLLYTGLFSLLFAVYDLCVTNSVHLLVSNTYLLYLTEMMTLMIVSGPLLMLARESVDERCHSFIDAALLLTLLNFGAQVVCHFFLGLELRMMLVFTHITIVVNLLLLAGALLRNRRFGARKWQFLISMLPLVLGGVLDLVRFYCNWSEPLNLLFRSGTFLFVIIQIGYIVRAYIAVYRRSVESDFYEKLAYHDTLTGLNNRAAYERDIRELAKSLSGHPKLWCISVDINNLKQTNDQFGHLAGDILIRNAAEVLCAALGSQERVYRMGGDEFVLLLTDMESGEVQEAMERIRDELTVRAKMGGGAPPLSLALGCDCYRPEDGNDLDRVYSRADAKMYESKQEYKLHHA